MTVRREGDRGPDRVAADPVVVRLHPDEWELFRALRERALSDAPEAFGSTLERERALSEERWRARLARGPLFAARLGEAVIGMAGGVPGLRPPVAELVSMWVEPAWRGAGIGDRLVGAVLGWARDEGYREVCLWVSDGNTPAERLYARHGFIPTGERQAIRPDDPSRMEHAMAVRLQ